MGIHAFDPKLAGQMWQSYLQYTFHEKSVMRRILRNHCITFFLVNLGRGVVLSPIDNNYYRLEVMGKSAAPLLKLSRKKVIK